MWNNTTNQVCKLFIVNTFVNNQKSQIYPRSTLLIHFRTVSCKPETRQKWLTVCRYTVNLVLNSVQITKQSLETETETEADTTHLKREIKERSF